MTIAEARRAQKAERAQTSEIPVRLFEFERFRNEVFLFQRSIIFRRRVRTPPTFIRQQDFSKQLEAQIKAKKDEQRAEREDRDFVERLEQIQLAQSFVENKEKSLVRCSFSFFSLAKERETFFKNKKLHQETLKNTLDDQVRRTKTNFSEKRENFRGFRFETKRRKFQRLKLKRRISD